MNTSATVALALIAPVLTIASVIFAAGRLEGRMSARLSEIDRRLGEVEHALTRLGFPFRAHRRDVDDDERS